MKFEKIHHVAIIASDYEASKAFYTEVLELPIIRENYRADRNSYKLDLKLGESEIELFSFPNPPERRAVQNQSVFAISVFMWRMSKQLWLN